VEVGQKRVFACALDWPGWCRAGNTENAALDALVASAPRYALVAQEAGLAFPDMQRDAIHVVARLEGSASYTDFGVPGAILASDRKPWSEAEAARQIALIRAAWTVFDRVAALTPADLRKGPRGGGRDRDKVIDHVLGAEVAYARKLGVQHRQPARDDTEAIMAIRDTISAALQAASPRAVRVDDEGKVEQPGGARPRHRHDHRDPMPARQLAHTPQGALLRALVRGRCREGESAIAW
jgi:hypothetical protein